MKVVLWQLYIIGSFVLLGLVARIGRWRLGAVRLGIVALAVGWTLWTLARLFSFNLIFVQLVSIWGSAWVLQRLARQRALIDTQAPIIASLRQSPESGDNPFSPPAATRALALADAGRMLVLTGLAEHRALLREAMEGATRRLVILSGWAKPGVVDRGFRERLRACLRRGVDVFIGYGWGTGTGGTPPPLGQQEAGRKLLEIRAWALQQKTPGQLVIAVFNNHAKLLFCDDRFVACGSFNWLSNARGGAAEVSLKLADPDLVGPEAERRAQEIMREATVAASDVA